MDTTFVDNEKLRNFMTAVNTQIDERVSILLNDAETEKIQIINSAKAEASLAADKHYKDELKKHGNQYVRDISKATLDMKKDILRHREELTDNVFKGVEEKIKEFRKTPKYVDYLVKSLLLMNITDEAEISLSPEDMMYADTLKKVLKTDNVTFNSDVNIRFGGLLAFRKSKGTIIDKTFDIALDEQKKIFTNSNAFAM